MKDGWRHGRAPSTGRLLGLTAVTLGLAIAVGASDPRPVPSTRPLVVPGLSVDALERLELEVPGRAAVTVDLAEGGGRITAPVAAAVDERAVRDLISAVAAARVDRGGPAGAWRRGDLDQPRAILRLRRRGGATVELRVGSAVPASGQVWLGVGRRPVLVPAWLADALVRDPDSLRQRRPFPAAVALTALEVHAPDLDLVLAGAPLKRQDPAARVAIDRGRLDRLLEAVAGLELEVATAPGDVAASSLTVRVPSGAASAELTMGGPCPGQPTLRLVTSTIGDGCVAAVALEDVRARARALTEDAAIAAAPIERFDRGTVTSLALGGDPAVRLEADGGGWRVARGDETYAVDGALADAVVTALTAPAAVRPLTSPSPSPSSGGERWTLRRTSGEVETWTVERGAARVTIRRGGEPVVLELAPGPAAVVREIGLDLRDRTLVAIEPNGVTALEATGDAPARLVRGALVDEWIVLSPPGAIATAGASALCARLAGLRATAWLADGALGRVRRTVRITVEQPGAVGPRVVTLELFGAPGSRCGVRVDGGRPARLAGDDCVALWSSLAVGARR